MPFMQTIFRGTSGSNPGNNQKEAERDDMIDCHWKWWLWRSTQRMAGDIILDYVIDMSYQVV